MLTGSYLALPPWLLYGFFFVLGSVIGSFLNVVIYRVPREISLSYPESRCPSCGKSIRWYHNVPILGWLMLRGRCADCGAKIAARYPLVEGFVGGLFVVVAMADLPWIVETLDDGSTLDVIDLFSLFPYSRDLVLLCTLLVCAWIQLDGATPPKRILLWCLVLLALTWVIQIICFGLALDAIPWWMIIPASQLGLLAGLILGYVLTWTSPAPEARKLRAGVHLATILSGAVVWYGIVFIACLVSLLQLGESLLRLVRGDSRRLGIFTWLFAATLLWTIVAAPAMDLNSPWFPWVLLVSALLTPLWSLLAGLVEIQYQSERPPAEVQH